MKTTTRMMSDRKNGRNANLSLEQLSILYQQTKNESIIAEAFIRSSAIIVYAKKYFPQVDSCDYISIALEKLEMCLRTYKPNNCRFTTYFYNVFKNNLKQEVKSLNYHKRCIIFNSTSLNCLVDEDGFDVAVDRELDYHTICLPNGLTEKELQYCQLLAMDYGTNKEIADYMKVSTMTLCNLRKSLRPKLECLYK